MQLSGICLRLCGAVFCAALLLAGQIKLSSSSKIEKSINSSRPHFLYMRKLRDYLSSADDIVLPDSRDISDTVQGKLVATSIETKTTKGRGYSDRGFVFEGTNKLELEFAVPRQSKGKDYPKVELWIFPDKSRVEQNTVEDIAFLAKASMAEVSNPRTEQGIIRWNTREDCVVLNLTNLSKKIYKVLQRRNLNESNVSMVIEITRKVTRRITLENDPAHSLQHNICSDLSQRSTDDPFLVIKNYDEKMADVIGNRGERQDITSNTIHSVSEMNTVNATSPNNCCNKSSLVVNLAKIYGSFVKGPTDINIWDCTGECTITSNSNLFTHHATVKERLKLLPKGEALSDFQPHCTPVAFKPLHVHFSVQNKSDVIVQLLDLVVGKCGCR